MVLSKGKTTKFKKNNPDNLRLWSKNICVLISLINIKKKTFGLVKYSDGSISYIQPSYGFFLGDLTSTSSNPPTF